MKTNTMENALLGLGGDRKDEKMTVSNAANKSINKLQVLIGLLALLVGTLVYLIDRPAEATYFVHRFGFILNLHNMLQDSLPRIFGSIGGFLPEFIHVFSFIMLTAGIAGCGKKGYIVICISWLIIDTLFELGQRYNTLILKIIPDSFSRVPILESVEGYFRKGTFDLVDVIWILIGTVAAYLVLLLTMDSRSRASDPR